MKRNILLLIETEGLDLFNDFFVECCVTVVKIPSNEEASACNVHDTYLACSVLVITLYLSDTAPAPTI